ncbi:MAG: hypothetical protein MRERV_61c004 [Mycoplasmataceae bacterium RV_VA103A]|nr:MAG: hypothetical protein MRERV_61c004 [Mycoplasmataceae bacterium RV_VA103A]
MFFLSSNCSTWIFLVLLTLSSLSSNWFLIPAITLAKVDLPWPDLPIRRIILVSAIFLNFFILYCSFCSITAVNLPLSRRLIFICLVTSSLIFSNSFSFFRLSSCSISFFLSI